MARGKIKESRLLGGWKKKQWFTILAPRSFNEKPVGETPAFSPEKIIGRTVSVNLMTLTGNIRKQNMSVMLEINKVAGNKAHTILKSYEIVPAFIRRIVRRERDRVDETIKRLTSDNREVVVKLFLMTSKLSSSSQLKSLRKISREFIIEEAKKLQFEAFLLDIISGRLMREMKTSLKKVLPLNSVEIRKAELVSERDAYGRAKKAEIIVEEAEPEEETVEKSSAEEEKSEDVPKEEEKPKASVKKEGKTEKESASKKAEKPKASRKKEEKPDNSE